MTAKTKIMTLRLTPELVDAYQRCAKRSGMSLNSFMSNWLETTLVGADDLASSICKARAGSAEMVEAIGKVQQHVIAKASALLGQFEDVATDLGIDKGNVLPGRFPLKADKPPVV